MTEPDRALVAASERVLATRARSFRWGAVFLPRAARAEAAVVYAFDPDGITAFDGVNMLLRSADPATGLVVGGNAGNYRLVASVLMGSLAAGVTTIAGGNNTQLLV